VTEPVAVEVRRGDCPCPGAIHPIETVLLEPEATMPMAAAALYGMQNAAEPAGRMAALISAYLPAGIRSWTFVEHNGDRLVPVEITRASMERLIPWDRGGFEVANKADDLYSGRVTAPLVRMSTSRSAGGPTDDSTSPSLPSSPDTPTWPEPSWRNGTDGRPSEVPDR
jgi:hypothetical protein